jgi:hypothetical protein
VSEIKRDIFLSGNINVPVAWRVDPAEFVYSTAKIGAAMEGEKSGAQYVLSYDGLLSSKFVESSFEGCGDT